MQARSAPPNTPLPVTRSLWIGLLALLLLVGGSIAGYFLLQKRLVPLQAVAAMPQTPMLILRMPGAHRWPALPAGQLPQEDQQAHAMLDQALDYTPLVAGLHAVCAAWRGEQSQAESAPSDSTASLKPSASSDSSTAAPAAAVKPQSTPGASGEALWAAAYLGAGGRIDWLLVRRETEGRGFQIPGLSAAQIPSAAPSFEGIALEALPDGRWSFRHRGLRVLAANRSLAEDAVRCVLGIAEPMADPDFARLRAQTGKNRETTLYLHLESLSAYLGLFAEAEFGAALEGLGTLSRWMATDLKRLEGLLFASGYASGAQDLAARFPVPGVADWRIDEVLPARTRAFWRVSAGADGQGLFRPDYARSTADLDDPWRRMLGQEWAMGLVDPRGGDYTKHALMVLRVAEPETVDETLARISVADGVYEGQTAERAIRRLDAASAETPAPISLRFGRSLTAFDAAWFAQVEGFLLLSPDRRQLEQALDAYERGAVLRSNLEFAAFRERLLPGANATLYLDLPALAPLAEGMALPRFRESVSKRLAAHAGLRPLALQWDRYRGAFLASGFLGSGAAAGGSGPDPGPTDAVSLWRLRLDTVAAAAPRFVTDHRDGRTELLLEDAAHRIYLVDPSGRILWKRELDGPILGEVHQIDYYRNGKLQFAFATPGRIHLIDRKGRDVADFPIALSAGASTGLQVFDYEGKRDYRLFVGGDNGFLYGYYQTGKPLPGWSPMKGFDGLAHPPQHTAANGKDYIAISGRNGKVYLKDRRGSNRISPKALGAPLLDGWSVMPENGEPVLLACDTLGTVYRLHLDGTLDRRASPRINRRSRFAARNLDAQGSSEWITLTDRAVLARNADGAPRWDWELPDAGPHGWSLYGEGPRSLMAVWSPASGEWVCLNASGEPLPGFPTAGGGPCAIGPLNGSGSRVFVGTVGSVVEARTLP